jgi:hypothetical protein
VSLALAALAGAIDAPAIDRLKGTPASVARQVRVASENDFTFLETPAQVRRFVSLGLLVPLEGDGHYELSGVSFAVARPEVRLFVERLARQYHRACGERLVVTSLTRPKTRQPSNAHRQSTHRAGMAVDIRRSARRGCRRWLEATLRALELRGTLEATRERYPAHYHVAVFPRRYASYVAGLTAGRGKGAPAGRRQLPSRRYAVRRGDTLVDIARQHGTTVEWLVEANALDTPRILAGQKLTVPRGL